MQIANDTVVTLTCELIDSDGNPIGGADADMSYLHGGYSGIFPLVEAGLAGKSAGDEFSVNLQPDDAFGD